jgi:sulfate permease, SulP family
MRLGSARASSALERYMPALSWLPAYDRRWLRADLLAGLTAWAVILPQALAYAQIAGLPAQAALFATPLALFGYAAFGTSRQLAVSATSSTAAVSATAVGQIAAGNTDEYFALAAALAILCGGVFVLAGLLRLGALSDFIAKPVLTGFLFGLGLVIAAGQLSKLLGIEDPEGGFFRKLWRLLAHLGDANLPTVILGVSSLVVLVVMKRFAPRLPAALVVVAAGILLTGVFDLADLGVSVVGQVPSALPTPAVPGVKLGDVASLLPAALGIVLLGYAESISVARGFASAHRYDIRPNQELVALGASNALAGMFQGFVAAGGASQSAASDRAGAKTELFAVVAAALTVFTALVLAPLLGDLPNAVLGAIVINAVLGFMRVDELRRFNRLSRFGLPLALTALVGVLVLGVLPGLLIAVVLTIVLLLQRISRPHTAVLGRLPDGSGYGDIERHPEAHTVPGLLIFRLDAPLFFANVQVLRGRIRTLVSATSPPVRVVLLDTEATSGLDIEGVDALGELREELEHAGAELWLARVRAPVRNMLDRAGLAQEIGVGNLYPSVDAGVQAYPEVKNG